MKNDGTMRVKHERTLSPATLTGDLLGAVVDTKGFEYAEVIATAGTFGASATMSIVLRESATSGGSYTDVTGATIDFTAANDEDTLHGVVRLDGRERYLRCFADYGGSGNAIIAVSIRLFNSEYDADADAPEFAV